LPSAAGAASCKTSPRCESDPQSAIRNPESRGRRRVRGGVASDGAVASAGCFLR
jgi:hypothetical protein